MKRVLAIIKFIVNHPLASRNKLFSIKLFFRWQLGQWMLGYPVLYPLVENSALLVEKGMTGATGNIYTGLLEFNDMAFVLHVLRSEDLFGDVGANVGVYTILASKNAGCSVIAAEPIPGTFEKLKRNVFLNGVPEQVQLVRGGIGAEKGELSFTNTLDTVNHVLSDSEQAVEAHAGVRVPVFTLNALCEKKHPAVLKIDVEGFEWQVLQGASELLAGSVLKSIIIELNGSGGRYGYEDEKIHELLGNHGFTPYDYDPFSRSLKPLKTYGKYNTIYIRDLSWANERVGTARKFKILKELV